MPRLVKVALVAFLAGCGGDDGIELSVDMRYGETSEVYEISCDPPGGSAPDPEAACDALEADADLFFPEDQVACPLPYPSLYLFVEGTYRGDVVSQNIAPCSDGEDRAIRAWAELLGYEPPPFERR